MLHSVLEKKFYPTFTLEPLEELCKAGAHTSMVIAALFMAAKRWKHPRWPGTDEQVKQMWYARPLVSPVRKKGRKGIERKKERRKASEGGRNERKNPVICYNMDEP